MTGLKIAENVQPAYEQSALARDLAAAGVADDASVRFTVQPLPGDIDVLCVTVENREELPVFVSCTEEQILCIAYLFEKDEIKKDAFADMHTAMLQANVSVPLSAFGVIDNRYVMFGALAANAPLADVIHDIEILADNAVDALVSLHAYLA